VIFGSCRRLSEDYVQHPLAQFNAQDLEYFENFTGISLNTTKEVEPDLPMCSFREFQVAQTPKAKQKIIKEAWENAGALIT
jgi:hypothetical protein